MPQRKTIEASGGTRNYTSQVDQPDNEPGSSIAACLRVSAIWRIGDMVKIPG